MLYLSRAFVEFGPFSAEELTAFHKRGILKDTDYVRNEGSEEWLPAEEWAAAPAAPPPPAPKKAAVKKAKPAPEPTPVAAKKAPAKKAKK